MYIGRSLLCPTEQFPKVLWSIFRYTADDSAMGFCGTEAVSTVFLPNVFPEIARHADFVCLLSFEIAKSRLSKLSDLVN